ncbi:hypothetical protein CVT25_010088 [Psilocybe cyanescens]|uniref:Uncharacterized protein n=1 Tax=Psilocybe cyanescens TaxID=93625 RepID=A0A409X382_PSICY|nr:hypothetical protein CVT25_010088 [Psilocybe cyanescens]
MSNHPHTSKVDAASSMCVSMLSRNIVGASVSEAETGGGGLRSSKSSATSSVRTGHDRDRGGDAEQDSRHSLLSPSSRPSTGSRIALSSAASTHSVASVAIDATWCGRVRGSANDDNSSMEKMSPGKSTGSEVHAANANANAASNTFRKAPDRPDEKLTPSIVESDGVGDSDIYLTDEDVDADLGAGDEDRYKVGVDERDEEDGEDRAGVAEMERRDEEDVVVDVDVENSEAGDDDDTVSFRGNGNEDQAQAQDDTQNLTSKVPLMCHTPVAGRAGDKHRHLCCNIGIPHRDPYAYKHDISLSAEAKIARSAHKIPVAFSENAAAQRNYFVLGLVHRHVAVLQCGGRVCGRAVEALFAYSVTTPRTTTHLAGAGSRTTPSPSTSQSLSRVYEVDLGWEQETGVQRD